MYEFWYNYMKHDKGISINKLNTLNNEYKERIQELKSKSNYKKYHLMNIKKN